jgi:hypothetical protein
VVSLEPPAGVPASVFVGRADELRRLAEVYDRAAAARHARLVVILAPTRGLQAVSATRWPA